MRDIQRLEIIKITEKTGEYKGIIRSATSVNSLANTAIWAIGEPPSEEFWVVLLSTKNKVIGTRMISRGSINECTVAPRDVFMPAVLCGAAHVILIHNHPSGDPHPSSEDRFLTIRMCEAGRLLGIKVLDHVISAGEKFYSFREEGEIKE